MSVGFARVSVIIAAVGFATACLGPGPNRGTGDPGGRYPSDGSSGLLAWADGGTDPATPRPVAIAGLRQPDPDNASAPYTDPSQINCPSGVHLDGRASFDPRDPSDPTLLTAWRWDVLEYPSGFDPTRLELQGADTQLCTFMTAAAGRYVVELTVWSTAGVESFATPDARLSIDCADL
ncbi:MAG: hypothetical protein HY903_06190 [Deltaproteobacteria bacterium]|nr:hypothetical protein [Deltaproteobacteria bacterium]